MLKIFIFLLLSGCYVEHGSKPNYAAKIPEADPFFDSIINKIEDEDLNLYGVETHFNISISFSNALPDTSGGRCKFANPDARTYPYILINKPWWQESTQDMETLEIIIRHELGHCYYGLAHDNTIVLTEENIKQDNLEDNLFGNRNVTGEIRTYYRASLMYPNLINKDFYLKHKDLYDRKMLGLSFEVENFIDVRVQTVEHIKKMDLYIVRDLAGTTILESFDESEYIKKTLVLGLVEEEEELENISCNDNNF